MLLLDPAGARASRIRLVYCHPRPWWNAVVDRKPVADVLSRIVPQTTADQRKRV